MKRILNELSTLRGSRPRILLCDDQPINIRLANALLKGDYEIFMATSGLQAIELSEKVTPDLILMDVNMPGLNGYDTCERLKQNTLTLSIPVIFLTGLKSEEDEVKAFEVGGVDFISKPINGTVLKARVLTHLTLKLQSDFYRNIAVTDSLTGLFNRRKFDSELAEKWELCKRSGQAMSLLLIDIDHFKKYNDHYGHQAGDHCLAEVAHAIRSNFHRSYDCVARYGGEEFACILPMTGREQAIRQAQEVCKAVARRQLPHAHSDASAWVSLSIGVATMIAPDHNASPASLLALADKNLYAAKANGRAQVFADALPPLNDAA
ncbi:diguanylate cyclase [Herbaspirillum seropedicae]|uniref:diguanylate cyclase n=1 Tax=Herbaspirillum seropedicae TaxID=964 RepID=UPI001121FA48|nr:diguanylate cyclase [Herbaspirillum seropedicae]QDD66043.1 diguanylate cyclase [Herbaspirillum seropedicae]